MVDIERVFQNYMMKTYTTGEITLTQELQEQYQNDEYLICHKYEDGTIKVRTKEYNERCIDKW